MSEYEMLRTEMMQEYTSIRQYENLMYTVVVAVLVFALREDEFFFCLIPYVIIIPIFHIVMSIKKGICRIATYMMHYLEGEKYNWESRHSKFEEYYPNNKSRLKWGTHSQYYLLCLVSSGASIYKVVMNSSYSLSGILIRCTIIVAFSLFIVITIYINTLDYNNTKKTMMKIWPTVDRELSEVKKENES